MPDDYDGLESGQFTNKLQRPIKTDEDGVPIQEARYLEPTKDDLDRSQPISMEIVERVEKKMKEKIPGTLEDSGLIFKNQKSGAFSGFY